MFSCLSYCQASDGIKHYVELWVKADLAAYGFTEYTLQTGGALGSFDYEYKREWKEGNIYFKEPIDKISIANKGFSLILKSQNNDKTGEFHFRKEW